MTKQQKYKRKSTRANEGTLLTEKVAAHIYYIHLT